MRPARRRSYGHARLTCVQPGLKPLVADHLGVAGLPQSARSAAYPCSVLEVGSNNHMATKTLPCLNTRAQTMTCTASRSINS
eukprot:4418957-Pyramimonas_sp.AAC.1